MSPEVVLCWGHNTKADIYSLGASIIHMQTGHPPWVRRYPPSAYPSYLYIVGVLTTFMLFPEGGGGVCIFLTGLESDETGSSCG